jgi:DNA-binding MarR family transcriptional regulator
MLRLYKNNAGGIKAMNTIDKHKFIFGSLFVLANKLQVIGDQYLGSVGITTKQWLLTAMISQFRDSPPTLSEVAELMGSSRQNVKQLALKLTEEGFLTIEKDEEDARALRLKLTEKSRTFWVKRQKQDDQFIEDLFNGFSEEEVDIIFKGFGKLFGNIEKLEKSI